MEDGAGPIYFRVDRKAEVGISSATSTKPARTSSTTQSLPRRMTRTLLVGRHRWPANSDDDGVFFCLPGVFDPRSPCNVVTLTGERCGPY